MSTGLHRQDATSRTNRKARRAAALPPLAPVVAVTPVVTHQAATGHGRFVGRVGALAMALGLGAAVTIGLGNPAVAWADGETDTTQNVANEPPPSTPPGEGGAAEPGAGTTQAPAAGAPVGSSGPKLPSIFTQHPGRAIINAIIGRSATPTTRPVTPNTTTQQVTNTAVTPTAANNAALPASALAPARVAPAETRFVPRAIPAIPAFRALVRDAAPALQHTEQSTPTADVLSSAPAQRFSLAAATAPGTPAPAPLITQPDNPIEALRGTPAAISNIAVAAISTLLSSVFNPGPSTPTPPLALFAVLGFVRREFERTFDNQSPTAVADLATTAEDQPTTIAALTNDKDRDLPAGDVLTVTNYTQPDNGTVVLNPNGTFTYTPDANYNGTDTFTYTVSDAASPWHVHGLSGFFHGGEHTSSTTVTVAVGAVNDATVANDDSATVAEDSGTTTINVLANDNDPDGPLTITGVTQPTGGTVAIIGGGTAVSYTPNPNFNGGPNTFTYTVTQGGVDTNATVNITVTSVPDPTVANDDTATVLEDSGTTTINVLANDNDPDGPLTITGVTQPTGGTVAITGGGTAVSYTPNPNFNGGPNTFTYTVTQGGVDTTATVNVTVTSVPDPTVANDDTATVARGLRHHHDQRPSQRQRPRRPADHHRGHTTHRRHRSDHRRRYRSQLHPEPELQRRPKHVHLHRHPGRRRHNRNRQRHRHRRARCVCRHQRHRHRARGLRHHRHRCAGQRQRPRRPADHHQRHPTRRRHRSHHRRRHRPHLHPE